MVTLQLQGGNAEPRVMLSGAHLENWREGLGMSRQQGPYELHVGGQGPRPLHGEVHVVQEHGAPM